MFTLPFALKKPIDIPPIVSIELIQITDETNIPFAPKARELLEKIKKEEERVVSEQAPPAAKAKEKPDRIPMPEDKKEKKELKKKDVQIRVSLNLGKHSASVLGCDLTEGYIRINTDYN